MACIITQSESSLERFAREFARIKGEPYSEILKDDLRQAANAAGVEIGSGWTDEDVEGVCGMPATPEQRENLIIISR